MLSKLDLNLLRCIILVLDDLVEFLTELALLVEHSQRIRLVLLLAFL